MEMYQIFDVDFRESVADYSLKLKRQLDVLEHKDLVISLVQESDTFARCVMRCGSLWVGEVAVRLTDDGRKEILLVEPPWPQPRPSNRYITSDDYIPAFPGSEANHVALRHHRRIVEKYLSTSFPTVPRLRKPPIGELIKNFLLLPEHDTDDAGQAAADDQDPQNLEQAAPPQQVPGPVNNKLDRIILELVQDDPDLTDTQIGQRVELGRQAVNRRRNKLAKKGYKVR